MLNSITTIASLIVGLIAFGYALYERRERIREKALKLEGSVQRFHIDSAKSKEKFYKATVEVVNNTKHEMCKAGHGVSKFTDVNDQTIESYVQAEEKALKRGVKLHRIQLARHVSSDWPKRIAQLAEEYPSQYRVYEQFTDRSFLSISVADADNDNSVVELLIDAPTRGGDRSRFKASDALIVTGNRPLAQAVRALFAERLKFVRPMTPEEIRRLAFDHFYFAYGANLDADTMKRRAPSAEAIGVAYLNDWRLEFGVPGPHLEGAGAGIVQSEGDRVWGVLYAIDEDDKYRLNIAERGPFEPAFMNVETDSENTQHEALVYIPRKGALKGDAAMPDHDYVSRMLEAARHWQIQPLAEMLVAVAKESGMKEILGRTPPDAEETLH
jgi:hypothetical protein